MCEKQLLPRENHSQINRTTTSVDLSKQSSPWHLPAGPGSLVKPLLTTERVRRRCHPACRRHGGWSFMRACLCGSAAQHSWGRGLQVSSSFWPRAEFSRISSLSAASADCSYHSWVCTRWYSFAWVWWLLLESPSYLHIQFVSIYSSNRTDGAHLWHPHDVSCERSFAGDSQGFSFPAQYPTCRLQFPAQHMTASSEVSKEHLTFLTTFEQNSL